MNHLYYGDNLDVLSQYIPDATVDLIYLDPPFNSNRSYNVLFREANGTAADSQITAFDDTWHWGPTAEATLREIETTAAPHIVEMMQAIVRFVGRNDVTAYLGERKCEISISRKQSTVWPISWAGRRRRR